MESQSYFNAINSLFNFLVENPLKSSQELINANNLKSFVLELDDNISNNIKITDDNSISIVIQNLIEFKSKLIEMLNETKFSPSNKFTEDIEELDVSKLANKSQKEIDCLEILLIISCLYCKKKKNFAKRLKDNKNILSKIIKTYSSQYGNQQSNNSEKPDDKSNKTVKVETNPQDNNNNNLKQEKESGNNANNIIKPSFNFKVKKESNVVNENNKEINKDSIIQDLVQKLIQNMKIENDLKKESENLDEVIKKHTEDIKSMKTNESKITNQIKEYENEIKQLKVKYNTAKEANKKFNPNVVNEPKRELDLIASAFTEIGVKFLKFRKENYEKQFEPDWLEIERIRQEKC